MTKPLSSGAQAVLTAYNEAYESDRHAVAAALRAAADQVLPAEKAPKMMHLLDLERLAARQHARAKFLAIATELKAFLND
jgi:hypothetical protein